ncbi:hypothetical protein [Ensifer soli]|uniref:hypothetical protein n=1 Tax=Ciceribacter sp. sgz301302 TaxID=3342379 RepID=UPI0035B9B638
MATNENAPGAPAPPEPRLPLPRFHLHPLHEAALRLADIGLNRPRAKTRDLVVMLLAHGARAWRHGQPRAAIHLHVTCSGRRLPVRLHIG